MPDVRGAFAEALSLPPVPPPQKGGKGGRVELHDTVFLPGVETARNKSARGFTGESFTPKARSAFAEALRPPPFPKNGEGGLGG